MSSWRKQKNCRTSSIGTLTQYAEPVTGVNAAGAGAKKVLWRKVRIIVDGGGGDEKEKKNDANSDEGKDGDQEAQTD